MSDEQSEVKDLALFMTLHGKKIYDLRYGENPHQKKAAFFSQRPVVFEPPREDLLDLEKFQQIQGKELSFNNLLDVDAAINAISQLDNQRPACVIVKHTNPCGAAYGRNEWEAFFKAWKDGDPLAAFGGIVIFNRQIEWTADLILGVEKKRHFDILVAPGVGELAKKFFSQRKNLIILVNPALENSLPERGLDFKRVRGGWLVQEIDSRQVTEDDLKVVTKRSPTPDEVRDLLFAWKICKSSKSNTIVLVKEEVLISSGVGQQDRKSCCQLAVQKARDKSRGKTRDTPKGAVAASDAFFPFPDGPAILIKAGVTAIIQPGGSLRDKETTDLCNEHNVAMVFTGIRCFRH